MTGSLLTGQAIIFAGGKGTRISEESYAKPKPMIEVGGYPMLWHIMKIYSFHGIRHFVIAGGYKIEHIHAWFRRYLTQAEAVEYNGLTNEIVILKDVKTEPWIVKVISTGEVSGTAERLKLCLPYIDQEHCFVTYGDGVADINLKASWDLYQQMNKTVLMTAVRPSARFGALAFNDHLATEFIEKPVGDGGWINGGFFIMNAQKIAQYLSHAHMFEQGADGMWETGPLAALVKEGEVAVYKHEGFWMAMDTLRDKQKLEALWNDNPPWRIWE